VTLFIRHARPVVDRNAPQDEWPLEPGAAESVQPLARFVESAVIASPLRRRLETADALGFPYVPILEGARYSRRLAACRLPARTLRALTVVSAFANM
jgi:hypothetical protein